MYEMRHHKDFSIFVGTEEMTAEAVLLGASGGVNGGANIFPMLYVNLYKAAASGDLDTIRVLQRKIMQISTTIYTQGSFGSSYLKGVKCTLSILGVCNDFMASPFNRFDKEHRMRIEQAIEALDLNI